MTWLFYNLPYAIIRIENNGTFWGSNVIREKYGVKYGAGENISS